MTIHYGEDHHNWKGDEVSYSALHIWVRRHKEPVAVCEHCGEDQKLELANRSHEYRRDLDDWLWLCRTCHRAFDAKTHCKRGHLLSGDNLKVKLRTGRNRDSTSRICRTCDRERERLRQQELRRREKSA